MTAAELIAKLQKIDPNTKVSIKIQTPKDAAWTGEFFGELKADGVIQGWVGSDDEDAFFPGCGD
jgi:hypothetical protein